ncbi:DMT family transporter [Anaerovorax odorimutans]|uniref:DMT family transporter n=1 Tax=Anaerovorax odorimutans TaxID=109327 RepID=A0ABT1RST6_9FIRM|nr:DMT family transporter [Anaerovorax odorimutans]MCQ4637931.1 DMT family transporter [Anaerovorax odorimutans]
MKKSYPYRLTVFMGVAGLSFSSILAKLSTAPSMVVSLYRTLLAVLFLAPFAIRHRCEIKSMDGRDILFCLLGGLCFGCHFSLYCESVKYTAITSATMLIDCEILFVAPVMRVFFGERFSRVGISGIFLTLTGSLIITVSGFQQGDDAVWGNLLACAGAFFLAMFTILGKVCRTRISNSSYSFFVYLGASGTLLIALFFLRTPLMGYDPINYLIALGFTVLCTFGGHAIFSWALKYVRASFVSTAKLLEPAFASIFAFLIFDQVPSFTVIAGGLTVIAGVAVYARGGVENDK